MTPEELVSLIVGRKARGELKPGDFVVTTLVTSGLVRRVAEAHGLTVDDTSSKVIGAMLKTKGPELVKKLKGQDLRGLILDLRWNPGGLLDQAVDVCQKFLPRGQPVVTTEGRNPAQNSVRRAMGQGDEIPNMPIVVLVNLGSASASETRSSSTSRQRRHQPS